MVNQVVINEIIDKRTIPYGLLLLADPSRANIDKYIGDATIFIAEHDGVTIGCYVIARLENDSVEIKNIVVDERFQGKGIGSMLLNHAIDRAKSSGLKKIVIGTGNSSIGQLYLYQKLGFRITGIKADFFKDNYQEPIIENGIECRDMIILTKELS